MSMVNDFGFKDPWASTTYRTASLSDLLDHWHCLARSYDDAIAVARQLDEDAPRPSSMWFPTRTNVEIAVQVYDRVVREMKTRIKIELRRRAVEALDRSLMAESYEVRQPAALQAQTLVAMAGMVDLG